MKTIWLHLMLPLLALLASTASHANSFELDVGRSKIELGETIYAVYKFTGNTQGQTPDFSPLKANFRILSDHVSTQRYQVNAQVTLTTEWTLLIEPLSKGKLLIPPISFLGQTSQAVDVEVVEPSATPGDLQDIMLETLVDKESAYVQEQIKLTYRLFYSVNIDQLETGELLIDNAIKKQLPTQRYQRKIDGRPYNVAEFSYVLIPQQSGNLNIPAMTWQARVGMSTRRSLFNNTGRFNMIRKRTREKNITIKGIPASFPSNAIWLPANSLTLNEQWSSDTRNLTVGTPVTRTITLRANGLEAAQLPEILRETNAGNLKVYLEAPDLVDDTTNSGLVAERVESAAMVLSSASQLQLSEISIPWWNTQTDSLAFATLPAQTLQAQGSSAPLTLAENTTSETAINGDTTSAPAAAPHTSWLWGLIALLGVSNAICIALLVIVIQRQHSPVTRKQSPSVAKPDYWQALSRASKAQDTKLFRASLMAYAREELNCQNLRQLRERAQTQGQDNLVRFIDLIETQLYAAPTSTKTSETIAFDSALEAIKQLSKQSNKVDTALAAF